jgi:hypothetical protein
MTCKRFSCVVGGQGQSEIFSPDTEGHPKLLSKQVLQFSEEPANFVHTISNS